MPSAMTPPPEVGDLIGARYRVLRLLGEGGNGTVFEAQNVLTEKRVAIKWLRASQANYEGARERMLREAQSAARVRHKNVVDIYDVGFEDGVVYLVMELLEGETLADLLTSRELPIASLISLLIPALRGVSAAHRGGVVHRDLKPENLFLASDPEHPEPRCVVLDFGVAKLSGSRALTSPGFAVGTPIFMPVEQLVGGPDVDARSDVHAIAVILYVALTGRSPYEGDTLRDMAMQMLTVEPVPVHELRPDLPLELCLAIRRSMSKEPSERHASVDALIADLTPYASAEGEAWGKARNLRTRIVPMDLGTPGSQQAPRAPRSSVVARGFTAREQDTEQAAPELPRTRIDARWWLGLGMAAVLAGVALWPRPDRAPRVVAAPPPPPAAPRIEDAGVPEPVAPAAIAPIEPTAPAPARARPKKRAQLSAPTPRPGAMSVDEFAIEE
ncbi:MAG: serine/threonine-protein kinase [Polyangiales bacterium]